MTSTLANRLVLAAGLKKFTPALAPYVFQVVLEGEVVPVESRVALLSSDRLPHRLPITNGSMVVLVRF